MIINFINPHALNLGEDFEYIAMFNKGKSLTIDNYRPLIKGINSKKQYLLVLEKRPSFFGRSLSYGLSITEVKEYISPIHIKTDNRKYNYYELSNDIKYLHHFFSLWKKSDPMLHVGNMEHQFLTKIVNYSGSYKFDNTVY